MSDTKFVWDGESIKSTVQAKEDKHTPKDVINSLQNVRSQIDQMRGQLQQMDGQKKQTENNLKKAEEFEQTLKPFEEKCKELQVEKLKLILVTIEDECKKKAIETSQETIGKDPEAYSDNQKRILPYLDFQKNLATHPKVAEKISQHIIRQYLYDTPVFVNPFKETKQ